MWSGAPGVRHQIHQTRGADPALPPLPGHIPGYGHCFQGNGYNCREITDPGLALGSLSLVPPSPRLSVTIPGLAARAQQSE